MAELYIQLLKCLRMVYTSEEQVHTAQQKIAPRRGVYDPFFHMCAQIGRFGQTMKGTNMF